MLSDLVGRWKVPHPHPVGENLALGLRLRYLHPRVHTTHLSNTNRLLGVCVFSVAPEEITPESSSCR